MIQRINTCSQWGKTSCASLLLIVFEEVTAYIEEDHCVHIIYFDLSNAFDSVFHDQPATVFKMVPGPF